MDVSTCVPLLDPDVAHVLAILAFVAALWCFVDLVRAMDARPDDERPGPNDRRK